MQFLLFFLFSLLLSCGNAELPATVNTTPEPAPTPKKYLALGDSYTIGHGEKTEATFPFLLQDKLTLNGIPFVSSPKVIARTGWTCDELGAAISKDSTLSPPYDLVTLLIGVNDQYRGYDINLYSGKLGILVDKAIELSGNKADKVIIVSIPDYGVTPFGKQRNAAKIAAEIDAYNAINKTVALGKGVRYVNITDISKLAENDVSLLVSDKLHPSGKMYAMWVEKILPEALDALK